MIKKMKKPILIQILQESCFLKEEQAHDKIRGFFIFQDQLMNIFVRTSSTESGILRLKWFYDSISKKNISNLNLTEEDSLLIGKFLNSLPEDVYENLLNYIESFSCAFERRQLSSILNEFIESCSRYLDKIFQHIFSEESCKKLAFIYSANFFLIHKIIFLENGWDFCVSKSFRIQIDEIRDKKFSLKDDKIKNKSTKAFFKTNRYFFNAASKQKEIFCHLKINPGIFKLVSIYYCLF
jgi:hypothetical protein